MAEHLPKIESFLQNVIDRDLPHPDDVSVDDLRGEYTGDVKETVLDGDMEIRLNIGMNEQDWHRVGSFSILLKTDESLEELAQREVYGASDIEERFGEVEQEFVDLIDTYCGHNPYEPILDKAEEEFDEGGFDVVLHDSVTVFDPEVE